MTIGTESFSGVGPELKVSFLSLTYKVRFMILGQTIIVTLEKLNPCAAREHESHLTQKH